MLALDAGRLVAQGDLAELAGASSGIEIELVEIRDRPAAIDQVMADISAAGARIERNGSVLTVDWAVDGRPPDELFDLAGSAIAAAGARLRRLEQRRRTLDDLFDDPRSNTGDGAGGAAA